MSEASKSQQQVLSQWKSSLRTDGLQQCSDLCWTVSGTDFKDAKTRLNKKVFEP